VGAPAGDVREAGELERLVNVERVGMKRRHHRDQLTDLDVAHQRAGLEHRPDQPVGDGVLRRPVEQRNRAAVRGDQAQQHVDRR
jgi:hypothetical protein